MRNILFLFAAVAISALSINVITWSKSGNAPVEDMIYVEEGVSISSVQDPDPGREYYTKCQIVEKTAPASIPGFFTREYDTVAVQLMSRIAD